MNWFQPLWSAAYNALSGNDSPAQNSGIGNEDIEATRNTAQAISKHLFKRSLLQREMKIAEPAVHYGIGTLMGAVYGVAAETLPISRTGYGTLYGGAVWLFADEFAMPAFGLSSPLRKTPLSSQMSALASHLVYGLTTDLVRRQFLGKE
jgi:uncharacterized membrane protein YagU involved in acid resistance